MKKINEKQSRRNIKKRKSKVTTRHAMAGSWSRQSQPMFGSGKIHYEVGTNMEAMSYGGIAPVHQLVTKLGLRDQIDADLKLLKRHLPYHESDHVLNMAYDVLCGGTRLEDIERLRHDVAYMNAPGADPIPDPTTAGDFTRRFSEEDVETPMESINAVRPKLREGRAADLLGPVTYLDVDGAIAPTYGECKAGMDISCKGIWGYAPLIVSVANTREVLYVVNRPGNTPSHADAANWIDKAITQLSPYTRRICLRGDTAYSLTANFDRWAESIDFILGMNCNGKMRSLAEALSEEAWSRLERKPACETLTEESRTRYRRNEKEHIVKERDYVNLRLNYEDIAEFDYQPGKCSQPCRVIALRKNIGKMRGEDALIDGIRYFFYITTRRDLAATEVVYCANERCDRENIIEQLKNGVHAMRLPLCDLVSNWAYMVIATLAWNIESWFAMTMHLKADRKTYINMEFRRFPNGIILVPCRVMRRARSIVVRIVGYKPTLDRLFSAWNTIERTAFG